MPFPTSDYVFFFSYMQPSQKGNILGMWSNADALAETNGKFSLVNPSKNS